MHQIRPFAALWAISKWAKSEIAQSESVGYFFNWSLVSCATGRWAIFCGLFQPVQYSNKAQWIPS
jgi:hypothetical protein